jgi:hypothetical protein
MGRQGETIFAQHVDLARKFFERPDQLGPPEGSRRRTREGRSCLA